MATPLLCLSLVACGEDPAPTDAGSDAGSIDAGSSGDAGPGTDAGADAGGATDAGADAATSADAGVRCFPLSGPSASLPDAISSDLTASSRTWMRPTGETCPATGTGDVAVAYDTVCYVNDTGGDIDVLFEMLVGTEPLRPAVVIYDGAVLPTDVTQCAAVSSDLVIDAAEASHTVPAGGVVTFVATVQEPALGGFQFVITPE